MTGLEGKIPDIKTDPFDIAKNQAIYLSGSTTYSDITESVKSLIDILLLNNSPRERIIQILSSKELIYSIDTSDTQNRSHGDTVHLTGLITSLKEVIENRE